MFRKILFSTLFSLFLVFNFAHASTPEYTVEIKDHRFVPDVVELPKNQKVKIVIKNLDPTPEEFESHDLNREKIIGGNAEGVIVVGPLKSGEYHFFGEFNEETAQGKFIVK